MQKARQTELAAQEALQELNNNLQEIAEDRQHIPAGWTSPDDHPAIYHQLHHSNYRPAHLSTAANLEPRPDLSIARNTVAQAVATGVFGLLQVKKILSTSTGGGTPSISGGGSTGGGARPSAETPRIPDFGSFNQGVGGGSGFQTNRAVVINQDIRDTNAMDNRINDLIKIGK